jgi:hypothetical protein
MLDSNVVHRRGGHSLEMRALNAVDPRRTKGQVQWSREGRKRPFSFEGTKNELPVIENGVKYVPGVIFPWI